MDVNQPLNLLGGISPVVFMRQYWQKKPLLIRQAIRNFTPLLDRSELFELAGKDEVQSRLIVRKGLRRESNWNLRQGPFSRRAIPPLKQKYWTLLVQSVDLHHDAVHALMQQFRFIPDARIDDVMISYASEGGGVGPHFDSYDVFLLQASGRRRWQIGRQSDLTLQDDVPLKLLAHFKPETEMVLEPGDMLYLPPRYAHDGLALDVDCTTYSIGFRAPKKIELVQDILARLADEDTVIKKENLYKDPKQIAVNQPAMIPDAMKNFAVQSIQETLKNTAILSQLVGEHLTEPKPHVWFQPSKVKGLLNGYTLDRRTKMMYDDDFVFVNGESYRAAGKDAKLIREFADQRKLHASSVLRCSVQARSLLNSWCELGWIHGI